VVVDGASCDAGLISITICDQRGNSLTSQLASP